MLLVFMGVQVKCLCSPAHLVARCNGRPNPGFGIDTCATMVVAGVFFVARLFPVFAMSAPDALQVVAYVGAASALFLRHHRLHKQILNGCSPIPPWARSVLWCLRWVFSKSVAKKDWVTRHPCSTCSLMHCSKHYYSGCRCCNSLCTQQWNERYGRTKKIHARYAYHILNCMPAIAGVPPFYGSSVKKKFCWLLIITTRLFIISHCSLRH